MRPHGAFLERNVSLERCLASAREEDAYEVFSNMNLRMDADRKRGAGRLFKTSLEKALFSSPAACIKSVEIRLDKLKKKYNPDEIEDIGVLETFKNALNQIGPQDFSRYQRLLELLRSPEYGWNRDATDDRLVIFTERIETMNYLAARLREDLRLPVGAIQEIYGAMSDKELQEIVEDFGRTESPIRVLIASDVASEGLNLHYLSHRMIHFDIPWSLMVFQQRNGRIDRYGQQKRPDIRYMMIESEDKRVKGDIRILEILIEKEKRAFENIGDPALLFGKFTVEDEELVVAEAIENGLDPDAFEKELDRAEEEFDPFETAMRGVQVSESEKWKRSKTVSDETLFSDIDYLERALQLLNQESEIGSVDKLQTISGLDVKITEDMRRRLRALMPEEATPKGETLRLSDDPKFVMEEMKRSMRNNMDDVAWPATQYLWRLHPIFTWVNDKASLLFGRGQAPIVGLSGTLSVRETLFIVSGSFPNRKSTPLVDEWFALVFRDGMYVETIDMNEAIRRTGLRGASLVNSDMITEKEIEEAEALREVAVAHAREFLNEKFKEYEKRMNPLIDEEVTKLGELQERHKSYQRTLFEVGRKLEEKERSVDELFNRFVNWVTDTLTIQNNPYIRIVAVLTGVAL